MDKLDIPQGTLSLMILKTLQVLGPLHGYGIARRIEETSRNRLVLNYGTLYPGLAGVPDEQLRSVGLHCGDDAPTFCLADCVVSARASGNDHRPDSRIARSVTRVARPRAPRFQARPPRCASCLAPSRTMQDALVAADRLFEILDLEPEVENIAIGEHEPDMKTDERTPSGGGPK